jgi:hypothetical protein
MSPTFGQRGGGGGDAIQSFTVGEPSRGMHRECLRDLRSELRSSYPVVHPARLIRIAREHGFDHFPDGFLIKGQFADRSRSGPRSILARANRKGGARGECHPLFSDEYYRLTNPDVAEGGVAPWVHYQVFGRAEGRSPHPLIDIDYLAASIPERSPDTVLDEYLMSPEYWLADTSQYADCQRFAMFGNWDGASAPIIQIVERDMGGPWIHNRLMLVDSSSDERSKARLVGAGFLLTKSPGLSRFGELELWLTDDSWPAHDDRETTYTLVPGFFLGAEGKQIWLSSSDSVSPDATIVRLAAETLSVVTGRERSTPCLTFISSWLDREDLVELVESAAVGTAIAPNSRAQEIALRQLRRDQGRPDLVVLEYGKQLRATTGSLKIRGGDEDMDNLPEWHWDSTVTPSDVVIVLAEEHRRRATGDPDLRALLASGASLCLVGVAGLNTWLPLIQGRPNVVVDKNLLRAVAGFVERASMFSLPRSELYR